MIEYELCENGNFFAPIGNNEVARARKEVRTGASGQEDL
jgi:hypothetical protein